MFTINKDNKEYANELYLAGELLMRLFEKYNRLENKKYLYKDLKELTVIEINTIMVIGCNEMKSMSTIANSLGVSFGTPTVTVDRLIKKGLVERIRDEEDRRQVFIKLSENGMTIYQSISDLKKKIVEKVFGILTTEESQTLINILSKLIIKMDDLLLI